MHLLHQILLLVHLVGFAALLGGCLVQLRSRAPEVNLAMVHGSWVQVVSGLALLTVDELGPDPVNHVKVAVKLVVAVVVLVLVVKNRKFADIPRGLLMLMGGLTLANAGVAVLWS